MASDLVTIGFKADATGIKQAVNELDNLANKGGKADKIVDTLDSSIDKLNKDFGVLDTSTKKLDASLKKLTDSEVKRLAEEARAMQDEMRGLSTQFQQSDSPLKKFNSNVRLSDKEMATFSRRSGQAGIQFQQFIGQVQGGQGVMLALSQQSADLGFVLGAPLVGAVAGISASLVGLLIPNLIDTTSSMEDLDKAMEGIKKTATDNDGILSFTKSIAELAKESEAAARLMVMAAQQSAKEAGKAAAEGIGEEFNDAFDVTIFQTNFDALKSIAGTALGTGYSVSQEYKDLGEQFGFTGADARQAGIDILVSLRNMEQSVSRGLPDAGEKIKEFQEDLSTLAETATGKNKVKLLTFVTSISEYVEKAKTASEMSKLFNETLESSKLDIPTEKTNKLNEAISSISSSLESQIIALRDGEEAAIRYNIAQSLGLASAKDIPATIDAQINKINDLKSAQQSALDMQKEWEAEDAAYAKEQENKAKAEAKAMAESEKNINSMINQVDNLGGAWSNTADTIAQAMGDIVGGLDSYSSKMENIAKLQAGLQKERELEKTTIQDKIRIDASLADLEQRTTAAQLSGISQIAGASATLFKEQSKEREALNKAEQVFTAIEIALALKKAAVSVAAGAAKFFEQSGWGGFAGVAAMIGVMGGLGFSGGSSGGASPSAVDLQESQGTGTVLGSDDKSESILEALENYNDIGIDQLGALNGILNAMTSLSSGIENLAVSLITSSIFGGSNVSGIGTTKAYNSSFFGDMGTDEATSAKPQLNY